MPIAEIPATQEELLSLWANNDAIAEADTHILAVAVDPLNLEQDASRLAYG